MRKSTVGVWKAPKFKAPKAPPPPPPPRDFGMEQQLCEAMRQHVLVSLRYEDDTYARTYQPEGMWETKAGSVCVTGVQIRNPNKAGEDGQAHTFTVGRISSVTLSGDKFLHAVRFDRFDPRYGGNVICSA